MTEQLRCGSLVFDTWQGLGVLAKAFYDHGVVTDPVVVAHGRHQEQPWYPNAPRLADLRRDTLKVVGPVLDQVDVMLFFETPFDWSLLNECRRRGVKTALMVMHECMPQRVPVLPDLWLCPSLLDFEWACKQANHQVPPRRILEVSRDASVLFHGHAPDIWFLPVPVDVDRIAYRERTEAKVFVHNAGHGGLKGRNGTAEVLAAMEFIQSPARFIIRCQEDLYRTANYTQHAMLTNPLTRRGQRLDYDDPDAPPPEKMVEFRTGTQPYDTLYDEGDVFLFPEGFNGLSLPLQEAAAAGMLIMAGARWPMTAWLHDDPLIPVHHYTKEKIGPPYSEYERAHYDPRAIAAKVDEWYGRDIAEYSRVARQWAEENSWGVWGPVYRGLLKNLAEAPPLRLS